MRHMNRMSWVTLASLGLALSGAAVFAQNGQTTQSSSDTNKSVSVQKFEGSNFDRWFAREAAMGGLAEVQLGQLAAKQGASEQVKQFGQRMVDDHTKANDQLKQIASQKHLKLPNGVTAEARGMYKRLARLHGAAFDSAYVRDMVQDHKKDVQMFQNASAKAKDPDLKNFASQTLPTIQEHLQMVQGMSKGGMKAHRTMKSGMDKMNKM